MEYKTDELSAKFFIEKIAFALSKNDISLVNELFKDYLLNISTKNPLPDGLREDFLQKLYPNCKNEFFMTDNEIIEWANN